MNYYNVAEHGIHSGKECVSEAIEQLINDAPDDTVLYFPAGEYYIGKKISVHNKHGLTIRGEENTVFITHFSPCEDPELNNTAFDCTDNRSLTFENLTFTTDNPTNCAGRVIAKNESEHTYDVLIDKSFPVTGWEHFWGTDTCDEEGTPDYVIETYDWITKEELPDGCGGVRTKFTGTHYEVIGDHTIRVFMPKEWDLSRLTIGHRVLYRYVIYNNSVFTFANCHTVALRHIEIERCNSMGAVVFPRSSDFTFDDFNIRLPKNSPALYSGNADGIHITGLMGYLHMKNCNFVGLGDDALNIHSQAGEIGEIRDDGTIHCIYRNRDMTPDELSPEFAESGDMLRVYDRNTFLEKGTITLAEYTDGDAVITSHTGEYSVGDILANDSFFASVHLDNCEVRHTRARGFLLQSRNMLIENCRIYGMSLPGIIISPDIKVWYEVGPSDNVEIRNCTFEKCGFLHSGANLGAIVMKAAHDAGSADYPAGVHTNLSIHGNKFINCGASGIYVSAARGVTITDNMFENCSMSPYDPNAESVHYDIALRNCDDICVKHNQSNKPSELQLFTDNCDNIRN